MKAKPGFILDHEKKKQWLLAFLEPSFDVAESSACLAVVTDLLAENKVDFDEQAKRLALTPPKLGPCHFYNYIAQIAFPDASSQMQTQDSKPSPLSQANSSSKISPLAFGSLISEPEPLSKLEWAQIAFKTAMEHFPFVPAVFVEPMLAWLQLPEVQVEKSALEIFLQQATWTKPLIQLPLSLIGSYQLDAQYQKALSAILRSHLINPVLTDAVSSNPRIFKKEEMGQILKLAGDSLRLAEWLLGLVPPQRDMLRDMIKYRAKDVGIFMSTVGATFKRYSSHEVLQVDWQLLQKLLNLHLDYNLDMSKLDATPLRQWKVLEHTSRHNNQAHQ